MLSERKQPLSCLQGTLFDGVSEWVNHGYRFFTQPQWTASKDGCMIAISTKFVRTQSFQMCAPLVAWSNSWPSVAVWREDAARWTCTSSARMHQCMLREHKQWHLSLFDLNSGEIGRSHSSDPKQMPSDSVYGRQWRGVQHTHLDRKCG